MQLPHIYRGHTASARVFSVTEKAAVYIHWSLLHFFFFGLLFTTLNLSLLASCFSLRPNGLFWRPPIAGCE